MVGRREQEREVRCLQAINRFFFVQGQRHAETLEHVRAARLARYRSITVLDDPRSAGRGEQARSGGQVQTARTVPAGTHGIDRRRTFGNIRVDGQLSHRPGKATNLIRGFALGAQARKQCPGERRVKIAGRKLLHQVVRLPLFEIVAVQQTIE